MQSLQFGTVDADLVLRESVMEVTTDRIAEGTTGLPAASGPVSDALGVTRDNHVCGTCGAQHMTTCPGHSGHIRLPAPVMNIQYADKVLYLLRSVCFWCNRLLFPDDGPSVMSSKLNEISKACVKRGRCCGFEDRKRMRCAQAAVDKARAAGKVPRAEDLRDVEFDPEESGRTLDELLARRHCGMPQPTYTAKDCMHVVAHFELTEDDYDRWVSDGVEPPDFGPWKLYDLLNNVTDEDAVRLGMKPPFSHPRGMVWGPAMPAPPMTLRPSRGSTTSSKGEDEISNMLQKVKRECQRVFALMPGGGADRNERADVRSCVYTFQGTESHSWEWLFRRVREPLLAEPGFTANRRAYASELTERYHRLVAEVAGYQDDKRSANTSKYSRSLNTSLTKNKTGDMRKDAMGKRQNYSVRAPISPHNGHIGEVYYPRKLATKVGYPERVTAYNTHDLMRAVLRGPDAYPGALEVIRADGAVVDLRSADRNSVVLEVGDTVVRHMRNGDYINVNRQPTLHRFSIRGLRVVVWDEMTIGIHLCLTPGLNGDFDGDEATGTIDVSPATQAESAFLMSPESDMMKDGRPMVAFVQHAPAGAYMLTRVEERVPRRLFADLCMEWRSDWCASVDPVSRCVRGRRRYTGREAFSAFLPRDFSAPGLVSRGEYLLSAPRLTKRVLNKTGGLVDCMYHQYGSRFTVGWMSAACKIFELYVERAGMTFDTTDVSVPPSPSVEREVRALLEEAATLSAGHDPRDAIEGDADAQAREQRIVSLLDLCRDKRGRHILSRLSVDCPERILVESGAKGGPVNIVQNGGMIGSQRDHRGQRFTPPISHVLGDPDRLRAYGFNRFSFFQGCPPVEFVRHMIATRFGLVATAVKTAESGTNFRRSQKTMEDTSVAVGGNVVNSSGDTVMPRYGHHGMGSDTMSRVRLRIKSRPGTIHWYRCVREPGPALKQYTRMRALWQALQARRDLLERFDGWDERAPAAAPYDQLLLRHGGDASGAPPVDADFAAGAVRRVWQRVVRQRLVAPTLKVELAFLDYLCAASLREAGVTAARLPALLEEVERHHARASVCDGESVGNTAAHRMSEPQTQGTLNIFHSTGNANRLGNIDSVMRVLRASDDLSKCMMRVYLKSADADETTLGNFARRVLVEDRVGPYVDRYVTHAHALPRPVAESARLQRVLGGEGDMLLTLLLRRDRCVSNFMSPFDVASALYQRLRATERWSEDDGVPAPFAVSYSDVWRDEWWVSVSLRPDSVSVRASAETLCAHTGVPDALLHGRDTQSALLGVLAERCSGQRVRGLPKVSGFVVARDSAGRRFVLTSGSCLKRVMRLPRVDTFRTSSNSVHEMYDLAGIDAVRAMIEYEVQSTFEQCGTYADPLHVQLTAAQMTYTGHVRAITERGARRDDNALQAASFEKTVQNFMTAAVRGSLDPLGGVTGPLVVSKPMRRGPECVTTMSAPFEVERRVRWNFTEPTPVSVVDPARLRQFFVSRGSVPPCAVGLGAAAAAAAGGPVSRKKRRRGDADGASPDTRRCTRIHDMRVDDRRQVVLPDHTRVVGWGGGGGFVPFVPPELK